MKVKVRKVKLVEGLKKVAAAVGSKEMLNILSGIMISAKQNDPAPGAIEDEEFGRIELTATDATIQICAAVPCETEEGGVACLPAKFLISFAEALPDGEVEIETGFKGCRARISGGDCRYTLAELDASEFPVMAGPKADSEISLRAAAFRELLRKVKYAAAGSGEPRRILQGVNVCMVGSMIRMVAMDGKRLSMAEHFFGTGKVSDVTLGTLPAVVVKELYRLLDVGDGDIHVMSNERLIRIRAEGYEITSKLYDDVYPNWTKVVPAEVVHTARVKRGAFLNELLRAKAATDASDGHMVKMTFDTGVVVFEGGANDISKSKTKLAVDYAGEKAEFRVNPALIEDVLTAIDDEDVTIGFDGSGKPLVTRCSISFVAVVMPLRVG